MNLFLLVSFHDFWVDFLKINFYLRISFGKLFGTSRYTYWKLENPRKSARSWLNGSFHFALVKL